MFKTLLKTHREKVDNTKKMYEVSLQKLKGAESQVSLGYASTNYHFLRKYDKIMEWVVTKRISNYLDTLFIQGYCDARRNECNSTKTRWSI